MATDLRTYVESEFSVKALAIKADVRSESDVKYLISETIKEFDRIDVVVNNAGIVYDRDFAEITIDEFEDTLRTNVIGPFIVSREAAKHMTDGSAIINVSSTNGTKVISPESLDYNISKIGLQSLTRDLAYEFRSKIRVNAIAIGWADTDMNKDLPADYIKSRSEERRVGKECGS